MTLSEICSIGDGIWADLNLYYIFVFRVPKQDDPLYTVSLVMFYAVSFMPKFVKYF